MRTSMFRRIENISLQGMQEFVRQRSRIDGRMIAMGPCPEIGGKLQTFFAFESDAPDPHAGSILLQVYQNQPPPDVAGHTAFCIGLCFVDSQLQQVAAYRPD